MKYYVYILKCSDSTLYTGITNNLKRRMQEHNNKDGSTTKYTRARQPVKLVYFKEFSSRSSACKEECRIKKLSRKDKELLLLDISLSLL